MHYSIGTEAHCSFIYLRLIIETLINFSSVVKPKFVWLVNAPVGPCSEITLGDEVISGIVSWGYMRSNRVSSYAMQYVLSMQYATLRLTNKVR